MHNLKFDLREFFDHSAYTRNSNEWSYVSLNIQTFYIQSACFFKLLALFIDKLLSPYQEIEIMA